MCVCVRAAAGVRVGPASSTPDDPGFARLQPLYSTPAPAYREPAEAPALYLHALFALRDRRLGVVEANFAPTVHGPFAFKLVISTSTRALLGNLIASPLYSPTNRFATPGAFWRLSHPGIGPPLIRTDHCTDVSAVGVRT